MCGIAGLLAGPGDSADRLAAVTRMARTLAHRGPDDEGFWADERGEAALGFRRLSIIDLSPTGHQPMSSRDGRYIVIFNGEIYNFGALRAELAARGDTFRGTSDTEVMLAAFARWGVEATIPRLWGMFAIALWDARERELHLIRDRLGKKPLYFGWQGRTLLFGSELKALRAHPAFAAEIDRDALASYIRYSYVPAPRSIYKGIRKLLPGSHVVVRPDRPGEIVAESRYWDPLQVAREGLADPIHLSDQDAADALEALLLDAVKLRSYADVPLGAFLSGGIDSSTVVALMQAQASGPVRTFTIGYEAAEYDESKHARAIAAHLRTDHTELLLSPDQTQAVVPRLPTLFDEPFADVSQIPTFLVAQLARPTVTVALSGDGGDEVFGGYRRYVAGTRLWSRVSGVPSPVRTASAGLLTAIAPRAWDVAGTMADRLLPASRRGIVTGNRVQKLASLLDVSSIDELYLRLTSAWNLPERLVIGGREAQVALPGGSNGDGNGRGPHGLDEPALRMMLADLRGYLPDDILVKVDRATMGASLEARAPLLDHRVVEFAWRLPLDQKIRGGEGKWLLRRVLERHVPRSLTDRPKQGFGVPIDRWLRGPLRTWALDLMSDAKLRHEGYLRPGPIRTALDEHLAGRHNRQHELWTILMFEAWLDGPKLVGSA